MRHNLALVPKGDPQSVEEEHVLQIKTVYYADMRARQATQINRAKYSIRAVPLAVHHMQLDHYSACLCEVFDERSGTLHAVLKRPMGSNQIIVLFQRKVKDDSPKPEGD